MWPLLFYCAVKQMCGICHPQPPTPALAPPALGGFIFILCKQRKLTLPGLSKKEIYWKDLGVAEESHWEDWGIVYQVYSQEKCPQTHCKTDLKITLPPPSTSCALDQSLSLVPLNAAPAAWSHASPENKPHVLTSLGHWLRVPGLKVVCLSVGHVPVP